MPRKPIKAYEDVAFLKRDELRAVRLQTELLKPQIEMDEQHIRSTVCIFGSARIPSPERAREMLARAETEVADRPESVEAVRLLELARRRLQESRYYDMAREFARLITLYGQSVNRPEGLEFVVMTGGGPGIMEAANRGAAEAGGKSIGLNITLPMEQEPNAYITDELNFLFHYFSVRKMHFLLRARALCAFPGGFGTMDELFETLTLVQTHKCQPLPIVLFGREFWEELLNWRVFAEWGLISPGDLNLFQYADTPEDGLRLILDFDPNGNGIPRPES